MGPAADEAAPFRLVTTEHFESRARWLPDPVYRQLAEELRLLQANPRHPSLRTHEVKYASGNFGGKIFEAYVSEKYRMTWEYGPSKGEITLRNADNHDDCLSPSGPLARSLGTSTWTWRSKEAK